MSKIDLLAELTTPLLVLLAFIGALWIADVAFDALGRGPAQLESRPRKVGVQTIGDDADRVRYLQVWEVQIDGEKQYFGEFIEGGEK